MQFERIDLFESKKDFLLFGVLIFLLLFLSLSFEYYRYTKVTKKKSYLTLATVVNQYQKSKNSYSYWVLKLKSDDGFTFYTSASIKFPKIKNYTAFVRIYPKNLSFLEFLDSFYAKSYFIKLYKPKIDPLEHYLETIHNSTIATIYKALYLAKPLTYELYEHFSALGISHLFAISGFHLGILSAVSFFLLGLLYAPFHKQLFPYRHKQRDLFFLTAILALVYLWYLNFPPSLLRSFAMFIVGFLLYDRGFKLLSLQTLFIAIALLLALFPRLFFSTSFWLSVIGVYYILLFLLHFSHIGKIKTLFFLPIWIFFVMYPISASLFHIHTPYQLLSIPLTALFTLFYPLSILLHLFGQGELLDPLIHFMTQLKPTLTTITFPKELIIYTILSLLAIRSKELCYLLFLFSFALFFFNFYI